MTVCANSTCRARTDAPLASGWLRIAHATWVCRRCRPDYEPPEGT